MTWFVEYSIKYKCKQRKIDTKHTTARAVGGREGNRRKCFVAFKWILVTIFNILPNGPSGNCGPKFKFNTNTTHTYTSVWNKDVNYTNDTNERNEKKFRTFNWGRMWPMSKNAHHSVYRPKTEHANQAWAFTLNENGRMAFLVYHNVALIYTAF